jgi:hypothetical protein
MKRIIGGALVAGVAVFGGVTATGDDTTRNDQQQIIVSGGLGAFAIQTGDCLNLPDRHTEVQSVEGVPCDKPHNAQAFGAFDLTGFDQDFPGSSAFAEQADAGCYSRFEDFVGASYQQSELYYTTLEPTEESWELAGDREILCILVPSTGTVAYDARGSGR